MAKATVRDFGKTKDPLNLQGISILNSSYNLGIPMTSYNLLVIHASTEYLTPKAS